LNAKEFWPIGRRKKCQYLTKVANIDVFWWTTDGTSTFCEVKLSEEEFGKAADDDKHRRKFEKTYFEPLTPHLESGRLDRLVFFDGYQFYRNVWHMVQKERSRLIFLLPARTLVCGGS